MNDDYYDRSLSRALPQFMAVVFTWTAFERNKYRDAFYENLRNEFLGKFDLDKLTAMLGK